MKIVLTGEAGDITKPLAEKLLVDGHQRYRQIFLKNRV